MSPTTVAVNSDVTDNAAIAGAGRFSVTSAVSTLLGSAQGLLLWDGNGRLALERPPQFNHFADVASPSLVLMNDARPWSLAALLPDIDGPIHMHRISCVDDTQASCTASSTEVMIPGRAAHAAVRVGDSLFVFSTETMAGNETVVLRVFTATALSMGTLPAPLPVLNVSALALGSSDVLGIAAALGPVDSPSGVRSGREVILGIVVDDRPDAVLLMGALRMCDDA